MPSHASLTSVLVLIGAWCAPLQAQVPLYDAGVAGDPPIAPDPQVQGWHLAMGNNQKVHPVSPDPGTGLNAWEIVDAGQPLGQNTTYSRPEFASRALIGFTAWEYEAVLRVTAGTDPVVFLKVDSGFHILDLGYQVGFRIVGGALQAVGILGEVYDCPGALDGQHHSFVIRKSDPNSWDAEFLYDGVVLGPLDWFPSLDSWPDGLVWGTRDDTGTGRARFHRVEFRGLDPVGTTYCTPSVQNSTGSSATLSAFGSPFVVYDWLRLEAASMPPQQAVLFLVSDTTGLVHQPGGSQGDLCLGGSIGRYAADVGMSDAAGVFGMAVDLGALPFSPPIVVLPGETWNFQAWFRDQNPHATSNFTDAVSVVFQ